MLTRHVHPQKKGRGTPLKSRRKNSPGTQIHLLQTVKAPDCTVLATVSFGGEDLTPAVLVPSPRNPHWAGGLTDTQHSTGRPQAAHSHLGRAPCHNQRPCRPERSASRVNATTVPVTPGRPSTPTTPSRGRPEGLFTVLVGQPWTRETLDTTPEFKKYTLRRRQLSPKVSFWVIIL